MNQAPVVLRDRCLPRLPLFVAPVTDEPLTKPKRLVPKVRGAVTRDRSDGILRALRVRPVDVLRTEVQSQFDEIGVLSR